MAVLMQLFHLTSIFLSLWKTNHNWDSRQVKSLDQFLPLDKFALLFPTIVLDLWGTAKSKRQFSLVTVSRSLSRFPFSFVFALLKPVSPNVTNPFFTNSFSSSYDPHPRPESYTRRPVETLACAASWRKLACQNVSRRRVHAIAGYVGRSDGRSLLRV